MSDEDFSEYGNDPGGKTWPFTMVQSWTLYTPLSPQARHLYLVLRSLLYEGAGKSRSSTRKLSNLQLRLLLGAGLGAVPSDKSLQRWRNELVRKDLIRLSEDSTVTSRGRGTLTTITKRSIHVRRYPEPETRGWTSTFALLNALEGKEEQGLPEAPRFDGTEESPRNDLQEHENVQDGPIFERTDLAAQETDLSPSQSDLSHTPRPDQHEGPPNTLSDTPMDTSSSSSLLPATEYLGTLEEEEEWVTPSLETGTQTGPPAISQQIVDGLPWPPGRQPRGRNRRLLCEAAQGLLDRAWTPERIEALIRSRITWDLVRIPDRAVLSVLRNELTEPEGTGEVTQDHEIERLRIAIGEQDRDIANCPVCNSVGFVEDWRPDADPDVPAGWHGHGPKDLRSQLYALEHPETVRMIQEMNDQSRRTPEEPHRAPSPS